MTDEEAMMAQAGYDTPEQEGGNGLLTAAGVIGGGGAAALAVNSHRKGKASNIANPLKGSAEERVAGALKNEEARNKFHNKYLNETDSFNAAEGIYEDATRAESQLKTAINGKDAELIKAAQDTRNNAVEQRAGFNKIAGLAENTEKFDAEHLQKLQDLTGAKSYDSTLITDQYAKHFTGVDSHSFASDDALATWKKTTKAEIKTLSNDVPAKELGADVMKAHNAKIANLKDGMKHVEAKHKFGKLETGYFERMEVTKLPKDTAAEFRTASKLGAAESQFQRSTAALVDLTHGEQMKEALDPLKSTIKEVEKDGKGVLNKLKGIKITGGALAAVGVGAVAGAYALNKAFGSDRQHMTHAQRYQQQAMGQQQNMDGLQPQMG